MVEPSVPAERWHPITRVLFRFGFVYLGVGTAGQWLVLALLRTFGAPHEWVVATWKWWALYPLNDWVAERVFGIETALSYAETGSGDTVAHWVSTFTWLVVSVLIAAVWSVLDRRRWEYVRLHGWLRLVVRFALVASLLLYGVIKVLPSQMTFALYRLVQPFGDMSPMSVLWSQTAASEPYEIVLGCAEVAAALLLLVPVTSTAGAVLAVVALAQVFLVNLAYDVPVKIFSFHLLVLAALLLVPEARRLAAAFAGKAVLARKAPPLLPSTRGTWALVAGQGLLGLWLVIATVMEGWDAWHLYGNAREKSPLYGIWNVTEYSIAGQAIPALVSTEPQPASPNLASERLRRIIFDTQHGIHVQRMDDSLLSLPATVDPDGRTVTVTRDLQGQWKLADLTFERPTPERLLLVGQLAGRSVRMHLELVSLDRFRQLNRGFHWVQEAPYLL
ncbi:DoxX family protein [Nocardia uniformis]|uniref:DoxX family protein n=1 Tax=Nocardia uniformis TaxID=53432 RepID=A0A849C255_9NOCA|nr:DoxX family protein [Nocardia uniformis]NNH70510.1 DoxX family protein [Nocardia uniformis]